MTDWTPVIRFETTAGAVHKVEQRYDRREAKYQVRWTVVASEVTYVRDRWYVTDEINTLY